jgi:transcriptional regulator with XRE-family HTH domain
MRFGQRIRELRKGKGLSQRALGKLKVFSCEGGLAGTRCADEEYQRELRDG